MTSKHAHNGETQAPDNSKLFESLRPHFQPDTLKWLFGDMTGANVFAARVADVRVIASCLLSKAESLPKDKEGKLDKEKVKAYRKTFNALKPDLKDKWDAKALPVFKAALHDYHDATKPLKKAVFGNAKFSIRSLRVSLAKKSGNVSVTSRHVANGADLAK